MANCHKCGKGKIKKRKDGTKKCRTCGYLPGFSPEDVAKRNQPMQPLPKLEIPPFPQVSPLGSCFDSAAFMMMRFDLPEMKLCHGTGVATLPGSEGQRIAHAWIEFTHENYGRCAIDSIWLVAQRAEHYRKNLTASNVLEYTREELIERWKKTGFPGPWDEKIAILTTEGKMRRIQHAKRKN